MCELQTWKGLSEPAALVPELSPLRSHPGSGLVSVGICPTSEEGLSEAGALVGALPAGSGEGFGAYHCHPARAPI